LKKRFDWRGVTMYVVALAVVFLDQYTKALVRRHLPLNTSWMPIPWLDPIVTLTYTRNTGAAFGLLPGSGPLLVIVAAIVILGIVIYYRKLAAASAVLRVAFGLILGGAIGNNIVDRLTMGYVTDFIDVRVWPIFNVADSAGVVGAILLAYYALFLERPRTETASDAPGERRTDGEAVG